jgi:diguanylate cyclase (GGDEF)-like protein/PAS domain S-box-containing protein
MLEELSGDIGFAINAFRAHTALRESEARFRQVAENIEEIFWLTEWPGQRVLYLSPSFQTIWGIAMEQMLDHPLHWLDCVAEPDRERVKQHFARPPEPDDQCEYRIRRADGGERTIQHRRFAVCNPDGRIFRCAAVVRDVTEEQAHRRQLEFLANYDPLTGLPNRHHFTQRIASLLKRAGHASHGGAVLFLGLDRFKHINTFFGHPVGDDLLRRIADRLATHAARRHDLARLGGDQFALVAETGPVGPGQPGVAAAKQLAGALCADFNRPFLLDLGREVVVTVSIGISTFPDQGDSPDRLLRNADLAMYAAKQAGRNTYHLFREALYGGDQRRLHLEMDLRRALQANELEVWYQPQVTLGDRRLVGVEALARWPQPIQGIISPQRFIPLSEETGLILPLGEQVLRRACAQGRAWLDAGEPLDYVAVNVSGTQFQRSDFAALVARVLRDTGLPPRHLELELTESVILDNAQAARRAIQRMRALGVRIAIDDFGTGYSSLAYLKHLPIDKLKIDQAFIRGLPGAQADRAIVASIIALARGLQIQVLAEGVETAPQADLIRDLGCDQAQGFLYGQSLPAALVPHFGHCLPALTPDDPPA